MALGVPFEDDHDSDAELGLGVLRLEDFEIGLEEAHAYLPPQDRMWSTMARRPQ